MVSSISAKTLISGILLLQDATEADLPDHPGNVVTGFFSSPIPEFFAKALGWIE
jgi:hypothetical protein